MKTGRGHLNAACTCSWGYTISGGYTFHHYFSHHNNVNSITILQVWISCKILIYFGWVDIYITRNVTRENRNRIGGEQK